MTERVDLVELAREMAFIASMTNDPNAGRRLMELVDKLLREAGLPAGTG